MFFENRTNQVQELWNKGRLIGQKPPLKPKRVWAIRTRLQLDHKTRDLALFNLAIDSKLRGCDLVKLRVSEVAPNDRVANHASVRQQKTGNPVTFEISDLTHSLRRTKAAPIYRKAGNRPGELINIDHEPFI